MKRLAVILSLLTLFLYFPSVGGDQDIWFHLSYGRHFMQNLTWNIDHSQFSWTPYDFKFGYMTWMGSSMLYIVYSLFSHWGLYIFDYLILGAIALCFVKFVKQVDLAVIMGILGTFMIMNLKYLYLKPDMFSGLYFAIACLIFYKARESQNGKLFFWYIPLFAAWVNTHGGFIVGLFLVSGLFCSEFLTWIFSRNNLGLRNILYFLAATVLSYAATCINPVGYHYLFNMFRSILSPEMGNTKSIIMEFQPVWGVLFLQPAGLRIEIAVFIMAAMMAVLFFILVLEPSLFDLSSLVLVSAFYILGMGMVRITMYFPIIWFFAFFHAYRKWKPVLPKQIINFACMGVILFLFVRVSLFVIQDYDTLSWFGTNWEEAYPIHEAEYVKKLHSPEKIWNDYLSGGYLLWGLYPEHKVFIDPRYGGEMIKFMPTDEELKTPDGVRHYQSRFPFKIAFVAYHEIRFIQWVLSADWRIAYIGRNALIILDRSIIPSIPQEALSQDVSPGRFLTLSNPNILKTLFSFYSVVGPQYGRQIEEIYARNVRMTYRSRENDLAFMRKIMEGKGVSRG